MSGNSKFSNFKKHSVGNKASTAARNKRQFKNIILKKPITTHARERLFERTGMSGIKEQEEKVAFVFENGYRISAFVDPLFSYLNRKQMEGGHYTIRVWEGLVYLFDNGLGRLITVYPIPEEYLPLEQYLIKNNVEMVHKCLIMLKKDGETEFVSEAGTITSDIGLAVEFKSEQKANNYIKNTYFMRVLSRQGYTIELLLL